VDTQPWGGALLGLGLGLGSYLTLTPTLTLTLTLTLALALALTLTLTLTRCAPAARRPAHSRRCCSPWSQWVASYRGYAASSGWIASPRPSASRPARKRTPTSDLHTTYCRPTVDLLYMADGRRL
jgi:hypothetical protein